MYGFVFAILFGLMLIGIPVGFAIFATGISFIEITHVKPLLILVTKATTGVDSFPLLAIPLFILVGNLMNSGGISRRLVKWANQVVGRMPGGIGSVCIFASMIFGALTGSGPATVAAIGGITIPAMIEAGYSRGQACGIANSAGAMGPIIPPSITMIVYACCMGVAVTDMFVGAVAPGILIGIMMIILNTFMAKRNPEIMAHQSKEKFSWKEFGKDTIRALGAMGLIVVILGGIYGGVFTPTEAAAVGVLYALVVGGLIYRELKISALPKILEDTLLTSATVTFILGAANIFTWILAVTQLPAKITAVFASFLTTQTSYLVFLTIFLLIIGALIDTGVAVIVVAPMVVPLGIALGIDPIHLGVLFCVNLSIGYGTPPFGYNLFMAVSVGKSNFKEVAKGSLPFLAVQIVALIILAAFPDLVTWLPRMLKG